MGGGEWIDQIVRSMFVHFRARSSEWELAVHKKACSILGSPTPSSKNNNRTQPWCVVFNTTLLHPTVPSDLSILRPNHQYCCTLLTAFQALLSRSCRQPARETKRQKAKIPWIYSFVITDNCIEVKGNPPECCFPEATDHKARDTTWIHPTSTTSTIKLTLHPASVLAPTKASTGNILTIPSSLLS